MIKVDRYRAGIPHPSALIGGDSRGHRETQKNIDHFMKNQADKQSFKAYKDPSVYAALCAVFNRKCAYCEVVMTGQQPGDIDHYRPKASVINYTKGGERVVQPGYYWLAASWDNLLLTCTVCNRPSTQAMMITYGSVQRMVTGKRCLFPLVAGSQRGGHPSPSVACEKPLLLDPCVDQPSDYIRFTADGFVVPAGSYDQAERGRSTIEVCGLNRVELIQLRCATALEVEERLLEVLVNVAEGQAPRKGDIRAIKRAMADDRPFTAYIRQFVADWLESHIAGL